MAISEDILVIGEFRGKVEGTAVGKAHIYSSDGNLRTTILSPEPRKSFGSSVAISGNTIVVGEHANVLAHGHGGAHIFDSDGNLQSTLQAPTPAHNGAFGTSVATDGDHIIIGEVPRRAGSDYPAGPGSAYVYDSEGNLLSTFNSPDQEASINFGWSLDISEGIIVVGEGLANVEGKSNAGRAYLFDTDGNLLTTLQAPAPEENAEFGNAVAISGDTVVVGEYKADVEAFNEGRAYVFDLDGNLLATLHSPTPRAAALFGNSVAVSGDIVVVGEPYAEVDGKIKAGKAYIFAPGPGVEPEAKAEPASVQEEAKLEVEEKKPGGGIPGFPHASITLGLAIGAFALWVLRRKH